MVACDKTFISQPRGEGAFIVAWRPPTPPARPRKFPLVYMGNRDGIISLKGPSMRQNDVLELKLRAELQFGELIGETA